MQILAKVITNAKQNSVEKLSDNSYKIKTTAKPEKGKANTKIIEILADYFQTSKSNILLIKGEKSSNKTFDVNI